MKAIVGHELGPPDRYAIEEVPLPEPGPGMVRIRVAAAGAGYIDALVAAGLYQVKPPTPFVPGTECAGIVDAIGEGVTGVSAGDRVCAAVLSGAFAEYVIAPEALTSALPESISLAQGAIFKINYATAYHGLVDRAALQPGETLMVLGAAGGVGSAAVQLGKALGARVLAAASTPEKHTFARQCGADETLDYTSAEFRATVKSLTSGAGVDVVFDPVAGPTLETAFRCLGWRGRHLVVGFAAGAIPALSVNLPLMKGSALIGVDLRQLREREPEKAIEDEAALNGLLESGAINPPVGEVFAWQDFRAAMESAGGRAGCGKAVLMVDPDL